MDMLLSSDEDLVRRLPLPLAQLYRRAHNAKTALEQHLTAFYLWEAGLKMLASVAIVEYAEGHDQDPQLAECLMNLARPSLGRWWEFVRRLVPVLADRGQRSFQEIRDLVLGRTRDDMPHAAGLYAALKETLEGQRGARATVRLTELFDNLVAYRNKVLGHAAPGQLKEEVNERMARALLAGVAEIFGRLDVLAGRRLLYMAEIRQSGGVWLIQRYELLGESARRIESLELPRSEAARLPDAERVYMECGSEGAAAAPVLRSLHPLLIYDPDADEALFLNARRGRQRTEYLCYTTGNVVDRPNLGGDQRELLARVLGMDVASEQVDEWASRMQEAEGPAESPAGPVRRRVGEFELLSELGRGGMGVVYRAWQPSLGRQVALKCLMRRGDTKAEARFRREIRALGHVEHPNLIKIFTSGADGDQWFYVMELVEGVPLATVCDRLQANTANVTEVDLPTWRRTLIKACVEARQAEKPLSDSPPKAPARPAESSMTRPSGYWGHFHLGNAPTPFDKSYVRHIVDLIRQVAKAAHALHETGVIHRDIKPGNIMVSSSGRQAVLMDLGLAQLADDVEGRLTRTRQFVGTLRYASPQQVLAVGKLDRTCDVYSLGATLWELLTFRPLYSATDDTPTPELMQRIQYQEPDRVRKFNGRIPRDLDAIVLKCLEKEPSRRYATARELADDLGRFLEGRPVRARPVRSVERLWRWARRKPAIAGLTLALLLALIGSFVLVTWKWQEAENEKEQRAIALQSAEKARKRAENSQEDAEVYSRQLEENKEELEKAAKTAKKAEEDAKQQEQAAKKQEQAAKKAELSAKTAERVAKKAAEAEKAMREKLEAASYHHAIGLAHGEWFAANLRRTEELLDQCAPKLRGWEWHYLKRFELGPFLSFFGDREIWSVAFSKEGKWLAYADGVWVVIRYGNSGTYYRTLKTHKKMVEHVAFSPDSRFLATASMDHTIKIWEVATGKETLTFTDHTGDVFRVAYSPDGKMLASSSKDDTVKIWDAKTGQVYRSLPARARIFGGLAFSPDGKLLALGSDYQIKIWDTGTGETRFTLQGHTDSVNGICFSPNGQLLATASNDRTIKIWDGKNGTFLRTLTGHTGFVTNVAFTPDSRRLASSSWDQTVKIWDATSGEAIRTLRGHADFVLGVSFSSDGLYLASAGADQTVKIWDAEQQPEKTTVRGHTSMVGGVAYTPNGRLLLSAGGWDRTVKIWDPFTGKERGQMPKTNEPIGSLAVSHDGQFVAGGEGILGVTRDVKDWAVLVWDLAKRTRQHTFRGHQGTITSVAFHPRRHLLASASKDKTVKLWDVDTGAETASWKNEAEVWGLAFSPDGQHLATASQDRLVRIWDTAGRQLLHTLEGHTASVRCVAFSPDGTRLASGSGDFVRPPTELIVWDLASNKARFIFRSHRLSISCLAFHPDGRHLASASEDHSVKIWDISLGQEILTLRGHSGFVNGVAFAPHGHSLASAGNDKVIYVWDATPSGEVFTLRGHDNRVNTIAFSPDGKHLVSTSHDKTLKLWDVDKGQVLQTLKRNNRVFAVAYSPDGKHIAFDNDVDKSAKIWDLAKNAEVHTLAHPNYVGFVAYDPKGRLLASACLDQTITLWDTKTWQKRHILRGHQGSIPSLSFSADGKLLASGSVDKTIKIWNTDTGMEIHALRGHLESVQEVDFHPDGKHLASGSQDKTLRIWNVETGKPVRVLSGHLGKVYSVAYHPSGTFLTSCCELGTIKVWDPNTGKEITTLRGHSGSISNLAYSPDGRFFASAGIDKTVRLWDIRYLETKKTGLVEAERARWLTWYSRKATNAENTRQWLAAALYLTPLIDADPNDALLYARRGDARAERGAWKLAVADFNKAVKLKVEPFWVWQLRALVPLATGDQPAYRQSCRETLQRFQNSQPNARQLAWTCLLLPDVADDPMVLVRLAEKGDKFLANYYTTLGAALYRAGQFDKAIKELNEATQGLRQGGTAQDWLFLAMATQRLGKVDDAKKWLDKAAAWIDKSGQTSSTDTPAQNPIRWDQRLELRFLRQEAERLIKNAVGEKK